MIGKLIKRHEKLAFYGVKQADGSVVFHRMSGFTKMDTAKNPVEYERQYIDEAFKQTDVVAFSPSVAFTFDRFYGNPVHDDIVALSDGEVLGTDAVRTIVICDMATEENGACKAISRDFSVVVDSEGNATEAYSVSGTLYTKGEKITGLARVSEDGLTLTFTADEAI